MQNVTDPKPIQQLLGESTLGMIIQKAKLLEKIDRVLADILSAQVYAATRVLNVREHTLVLASNNSATATHLRYRGDELLTAIAAKLNTNDILHIECTVRP